MPPIQILQTTLLPLQERLYNHPIYKQLNTLEALQEFMAIHVFVVWDFMNLLTALQQHLTSTTVPWNPPQHPQIVRFINEIKLEEESDIIDDTCTSHFDYYVNSMENLKMDTTPMVKSRYHLSTHYVVRPNVIGTKPHNRLATPSKLELSCMMASPACS